MYQNLASQPQDVSQPQITQPQQQQVMNGPPDEQKRMRYKNTLHNLGMAEVILGGILCLLCVVSLIAASFSHWSYEYPYNLLDLTYASPGLWCGGFLIASGILGLRARSNPSRRIYNANLGVSITASVSMGVLVIMSSISATTPLSHFLMLCHSLLVLVGFAGMVLTIVHAAFCCAGVCCIHSQNLYGGPVMYRQQQASMQPMMQVQLANGQFMMVPYQSVMQPNVQQMQVPVVSAQMPTASVAAAPNPASPTVADGHTNPPDYTAMI